MKLENTQIRNRHERLYIVSPFTSSYLEQSTLIDRIRSQDSGHRWRVVTGRDLEGASGDLGALPHSTWWWLQLKIWTYMRAILVWKSYFNLRIHLKYVKFQ